jgi:hypothetical protein
MNAGDAFSDSSVLQRVSDLILCNKKIHDVIFGGATLRFPNGTSHFRPARKVTSYIWNGLPASHQATYYLRERLLCTCYDLNYLVSADYHIIAVLYMQGISSAYLDLSLVDFRVGDFSYNHPITTLIEGYKIQRDVLKSPLTKRLISLARRFISYVVWVFFSQHFFRSFWLFRKG